MGGDKVADGSGFYYSGVYEGFCLLLRFRTGIDTSVGSVLGCNNGFCG